MSILNYHSNKKYQNTKVKNIKHLKLLKVITSWTAAILKWWSKFNLNSIQQSMK